MVIDDRELGFRFEQLAVVAERTRQNVPKGASNVRVSARTELACRSFWGALSGVAGDTEFPWLSASVPCRPEKDGIAAGAVGLFQVRYCCRSGGLGHGGGIFCGCWCVDGWSDSGSCRNLEWWFESRGGDERVSRLEYRWDAPGSSSGGVDPGATESVSVRAGVGAGFATQAPGGVVVRVAAGAARGARQRDFVPVPPRLGGEAPCPSRPAPSAWTGLLNSSGTWTSGSIACARW